MEPLRTEAAGVRVCALGTAGMCPAVLDRQRDSAGKAYLVVSVTSQTVFVGIREGCMAFSEPILNNLFSETLNVTCLNT